jgi:hypothetical protein
MTGKIFKYWVDKDGNQFDFVNSQIKGYTEIYAVFK